MQNPVQEAEYILQQILNVDHGIQDKALDRYYDEDVEFRYLWLHANGIDEVSKLMRLWVFYHSEITATVQKVTLKDNVLTMDMEEHSLPWIANYVPHLKNFAQQQGVVKGACFKIHLHCIFELKKTAKGYVIKKQNDYFSTEPMFVVMLCLFYIFMIRPWLPLFSGFDQVHWLLQDETRFFDLVVPFLKRLATLYCFVVYSVTSLFEQVTSRLKFK